MSQTNTTTNSNANGIDRSIDVEAAQAILEQNRRCGNNKQDTLGELASEKSMWETYDIPVRRSGNSWTLHAPTKVASDGTVEDIICHVDYDDDRSWVAVDTDANLPARVEWCKPCRRNHAKESQGSQRTHSQSTLTADF